MTTWLDLLLWRRGCAYIQAPRSMPNDVESSLLLDECRGHVAYSHPSPCQSIFSWGFLVFLSYAHIRGVPVSDIWYVPFFAHDQNTAFAVAVCDLLHPGVDQPYHTPLYFWSCLCELLLQSSSNRTFQIPVIGISCVCFKVQVSELYINTLSTIVSYKYSYFLPYLLTDKFLVDKYLWQFCGKHVCTKILLESLECVRIIKWKLTSQN